ncbi:nad-dependent epimerase dehydratase : Nucleoside-diphosphate-sugar epimerase OS=Singulisphaera acidiphila (strain ATCC BAA-1392 / DSM 18658 / VKM B-2454 / MOB10) GN=Sinac_3219 PE=4 SV=1: Epimerase [Gemmataceae bacterium]|nr:nad-dependent epimerase dehydratase : Nucleoside-diphosphate-sugar epimerase OS=Singulisphaera acidiphila (strain ATCC BAA-1392 / DSM 18658 / VKM B-2454 / MOB10) GN=Sinac_3219 PE=4 SV=1: Epimerase [Gemmataceae bacterium]VTT98111.1 nad-dependent epimerase dehydratase : Nucleoside-diphosphate-sugar epimerase OS=Singulisphaera acidiphila (strain ATCC BAA-1392 / DSM 18658 / VKM B-2454 / MOB10) GN=Sinac_3219 PE=4 SV=1: Epimerase [Gemmataceae bacterium]
MSGPTIVTGGAGFIGSHLVRVLVGRGERVRVVERPGARLDHLPREGVDVVAADIRDADAVRRALRGAGVVYHLAANPQLWTRRRADFHRVNYLGTVNVLTAALAAGARRVLHTSTESILTRSRQTAAIAEDQDVPSRDVIGPYCRSKFRAERFAFHLARGGAPVVVVNPTLPIGPGDWGRSPPTQMMLDFCRGKRSAYLDGDLNLMDVRDIAAGMVAALERGRTGVRYLLGAENWSIRTVFGYLAALTGLPAPKWRVPYPVALTAAYVSEFAADVLTGTIPAATVTGVKLTRRRMHFDASRTFAELGITPRPARESIAEAVAWFKEVRWV